MSHRVEHPKRQRPYTQPVTRTKPWRAAITILRYHPSGTVNLQGMYLWEQMEMIAFVKYINTLYIRRNPFGYKRGLALLPKEPRMQELTESVVMQGEED